MDVPTSVEVDVVDIVDVSADVAAPAAVQAETSERRCYICFDDDSPEPVVRSPCACTTMYFHISCQRKLVDATKCAECRVCRESFANVQTHNTRHPTAFCLARFWLLLTTAASQIVTILYAVGAAIAHSEERLHAMREHVFMTMLWSAVTVLSGSALWLFCRLQRPSFVQQSEMSVIDL